MDVSVATLWRTVTCSVEMTSSWEGSSESDEKGADEVMVVLQRHVLLEVTNSQSFPQLSAVVG
jgi:hypothetical protein